jgi:hypothetical protein
MSATTTARGLDLDAPPTVSALARRGQKGREKHSGFMMLPASNRVGRNARPLARSLRPTPSEHSRS